MKEGADADGAFDAAILAVAGLCDAEVDGVIPIRAQFVQAGDQEAVGVDHHLRIAGLHREDEGVVIHLAGDAGELEGALDHAERRVAVTVHDAVGEGAVVGADAHGDAALLAKGDQRGKPLADAGKLGEVLLVGILDDLEFFRVGVVAGIDADFLDPARGFQGGLGLEMDVGDDGDLAALGAEAPDDVPQIGGILDRGGGDADDLAAYFHKGERLADAGLGVHGVAGQHGLEPDGMGSADANVPDHHLTGGPAGIGVWTGTVVHRWDWAGVALLDSNRMRSGFEPNKSCTSKKAM